MLVVPVGCHNLLLDANHNVKIADFSGSVILHGPEEYASALVSYDARSQKPGVMGATEQTDIFALGSVVYELATGHLPYAELQDSQVTQRFDMHKWPEDLWSIMASQPVIGGAIRSCWEGHFEHADDVAWEIKPDMLEPSPPEVDSDDTESIAPSDEYYPQFKMRPSEMFEIPPPGVDSDDTDSVPPSDAYHPEPKPRPSEKRSRPKRRRRRRTENSTKREVSFFGKFLTCLGIRHTSSANRKGSYSSYSSW
jgi:protein kinase-like protein